MKRTAGFYNWESHTDPFRVLRRGMKFWNGQAIIKDFCSPAGLKKENLMVKFQYAPFTPDKQYSTTVDYLTVLKDIKSKSKGT